MGIVALELVAALSSTPNPVVATGFLRTAVVPKSTLLAKSAWGQRWSRGRVGAEVMEAISVRRRSKAAAAESGEMHGMWP
uniref:Uncharacterized protein n=1 Tax=Oryza nivara TaxID=4536 RepID=A0A0E0GZW9_ORYNI